MNLPAELRQLHAIDELGPAFLGLQAFQLLSIVDFQGNALLAERGIEIPSRTGSTLIYLLRQGPASVSDLARFLGMSHQLAALRVRDLKAGGLLGETSDPTDGRRTLLELSRAGVRVARKVEQLCRETAIAYRELFDEIGLDLQSGLIRAKAALAERSLSRRVAEIGGAEVEHASKRPDVR